VVAAIRDPFLHVDGGGLSILRSAGVQVEVGLGSQSAAALIAPYLKRVVTRLPYVTAKWAMTLDGKTAVASGQSQWISSPESRAQVHQLRGRMDAILVGIGTARVDDPLLTVRPVGPRTPVRIVMDSQALLSQESRLVKTARDVPLLIAVSEYAPLERCHALKELDCEVVVFPGAPRVPVLDLLAELGKREMTNLLVEGGDRIVGSFLETGQIDEIHAYIAPIVEGGDHCHSPARGRGMLNMSEALRLQDVVYSEVGGDLRVQGVVPQPWREMLGDLGRE
jgi:diaminohydroxyphosphoribosylaminopyrimidine deaminase/5-amino-6-(5-phosphoribosylamino)uracil reductase